MESESRQTSHAGSPGTNHSGNQCQSSAGRSYLSGGDPFYNPEEFLPVLKEVSQRTGMNIWCYTGYTYEQLKEDPIRQKLLPYIDVLVDGPFIESLYSPFLDFCGSSNQRILKLKITKNIIK